MLTRIKQRLRYWFKPIRCSECKRRCLSVQGLGRHLAKHRRERKAAALLPKEEQAKIDADLDAFMAKQNEAQRNAGMASLDFRAAMQAQQQGSCGVSDCKLPMPHNHFQEAK